MKTFFFFLRHAFTVTRTCTRFDATHTSTQLLQDTHQLYITHTQTQINTEHETSKRKLRWYASILTPCITLFLLILFLSTPIFIITLFTNQQKHTHNTRSNTIFHTHCTNKLHSMSIASLKHYAFFLGFFANANESEWFINRIDTFLSPFKFSWKCSHSFGEQFSQKKWTREVAGQREILAAYGGVKLNDVRGMRAPFLSIGGNKMFKMLYDSNFTYDSSMPVYENRPPSWPYTLDYKIFHDCMIPPCPTKSYPGLWRMPLSSSSNEEWINYWRLNRKRAIDSAHEWKLFWSFLPKV